VTNLTADNGLPTVSDLPNGIVQCGVTPGVPVGCMKGHVFNPAPRIGFAWDPRGNGKTAIRGGYGMFFEHGNGNEANSESLENSPPLAYAAQQNNIVGYANIGGGTSSPQFPLSVTAIPTKAQFPYVQQWHFDIQREFVRNTVAQGCVGAGADPFRPFPGYGDIANIQTAASSSYNALQVAVRRSAGGLELNFAYTYSHSIDDSSDRYDGSFTDAYNPAANRASSNFDQRHVLNFGYVWDLPLFRKAGLTHSLLGGWQYSGITTFSTGSPFSVTYPSDNAGVGNGVGSSSYADLVGNPREGVVQTPILGFGRVFYNANAYAPPTALTFGDSGRNSLQNPDRINFDMALFKHFTIKEKAAIEFRAEAFNVFNHTEWDPIAGQAGAGAANNGSGTNSFGTTGFLYAGGVHEARIMQFALKFLF
jgi:hypothetical protein